MNFALLAHSLPQPSSNGGPMTCWAVMKQALEDGHRVTVVALRYPDDVFAQPEREEAVRAAGAELVVIPVAREQDGRPGDVVERVFPTARLAPAVREVLEGIAPDAAFVYHWDTLAATRGARAAPRLAAVGDPWHLPPLRRWQTTPPRLERGYLQWSLSVLGGVLPARRAMVELLNECEASGCFQAQAAAWLRARGARGCEYLRSPILDPGPPRNAGIAERGEGKPKILLGPADLGGTATRAGLQLYAREILPRLEAELGPEGFEAHLVGEREPPEELARLLPRPSVKLRGRVEPADGEFRSADLQLVPTPFVLGIRLRIVTAFAFGCCVVAHSCERANIPELDHGLNVLLAPSGKELADAVVRAARDPELRRRLGDNGRRTYERYFHPSVAAKPIVERLVALAGGGRKAG